MKPIVLILLALNSLVFGLWILQGQSAFMTGNFLVSWDALREGRYWTLLASEFSHVSFLHFFINMFVLASFGPVVEHFLGPIRFLAFYLFAAVVASFGHAVVSAFLLAKPDLPALGASGAISGVIILFSLMLPQARILLFGLIPLPALVGALLFVGLDLVGLIAQFEGGGLPIGHGAHLGGALAGAIYFLLAGHRIAVPRGRRIDYGDALVWSKLISAPLLRSLDKRD